MIWKVEFAYRPDSLNASTRPWYDFAKANCLQSWSGHFVAKNIPHAVICARENDGRWVRELWTRYEYDTSLGAKTCCPKPWAPRNVPKCLVEL